MWTCHSQGLEIFIGSDTAVMSLCRNLAGLLLLLTIDLFLRIRPTDATPTSPSVSRPRIVIVTGVGNEDYDYDGDETDSKASSPTIVSSLAATLGQPARPCEHNPCLENQVPCSQLTAVSGCLCPGLSGDTEPPHPPHIRALTPATDGGAGKVVVHWCAPASVVSRYRVVVEGGHGAPLEFGEQSRMGSIEVEVGTKVCVEAVNKAGHSDPAEFSCLRYERPSRGSVALTTGFIGGAVALLLLLSLAALLLWRRQTCRNATPGSTEGLRNPSYSTEGTVSA